MFNSKLIDIQRVVGTRIFASVRVACGVLRPYGFNWRNSHFPNFGRWYQYNS